MYNFHDIAFDEGTQLKLEIFEDYLIKWLPTFLMQPFITDIYIYDFYCGPGHDKNGVNGSPRRILSVLEKFSHHVKNKRIHIWFNDFDAEKINSCRDIPFPSNVNIKYTVDDGENCLSVLNDFNPKRSSAHFLYIDPTGLTRYDLLFQIIDKYPRTDFLLFIPADHIFRLGQTDGFQRKIPGFEKGTCKQNTAKDFCSYCKDEFPTTSNLYLIPFSIKKFRTIHGLVFGSKHPLGLDKYLDLIWGKTHNGTANFDLDGDYPQEINSHPTLFSLMPDTAKPSRLKNFESYIEQAILTKELTTNKDVYLASLRAAFLPTEHAKPVLQRLKKKKLIAGVPGLSYAVAYEKKPQEIILL